MDVILLLFLAVCLIEFRFAPRGGLFNETGLERDHTTALRGFLCILIVLDHGALLTRCGLSVPVLKRVGPYVVGVFYALSGYGLLASYRAKDCSLKGFWAKRLRSTILPYLILSVAALAVRLLVGEKLGPSDVLASFVNGHPLVLYSWFILTIIVFYAIFYVSARLAGRDIPLLIALTAFALFFFVFAMKKLGYEEFWFNAAWCFPLGLVWQWLYDRISSGFRRHPAVYLSMTGLIAAWLVLAAEHFFWFDYLGRLLSTLAVCVFVLLLAFKLRIGNPALRFLGGISLEIYLVHGLIVTALSPFLPPEMHPYAFMCILLAATISLAWLLHRLFAGFTQNADKKE